MSTIKINELASTSISLTDFFVKANSAGLASKNTFQELSDLINTVDNTEFKGSLSIAQAALPESVDGWYFANESGNYVVGGITLAVTVSDNLAILIISSSRTAFVKVDIPVNITIDATVINGSANAVSGNAVFDAIEAEQVARIAADVLKSDKIVVDNLIEVSEDKTYTNGEVLSSVLKTDPLVELGGYSSIGTKTVVGLDVYRLKDPIEILPNKLYNYFGRLYTSTNTCLVVVDESMNVLNFYNGNDFPASGTANDFNFTTEPTAKYLLMCWFYAANLTEMRLTFEDTTTVVTGGTDYKVVKSIKNGSTSITPDSLGVADITDIYKSVELTNYAIFPDTLIDIVNELGVPNSNVVDDTRLFDVLTHTVVNDIKLGKGFTFNVANDSNKTLFTFTWANPNYMSFVVKKDAISAGDRIGFSNTSGGFAWLTLATETTVTANGFTINVLEQIGNYLRIECYHATDARKKLWCDFDTTSDATIYDLIVSPNTFNKYATYQHIYKRNQSTLVGKRVMTWGDSNLSFGISYALKEQLGINVSANGAGGRRMGINDGVTFSAITTSNYATQTSDGNWLGSWYRKKAIKYAIDTYGSIDLMTFFTCYNDGAGEAFMNTAGTLYTVESDIPSGTEGDFTNYSQLTDAAIAAVEYNYPQLTDTDSEKDVKYARFLALTSAEKKQMFAYKQTFAALIKEVLAYNPNCLISLSSLLYLPASDDGGATASTNPATWRSRKPIRDIINGHIKDIAYWFGVYFCDNNNQVGYYIGNAQTQTPDGTHFTADIGYRIGFNTSAKVLQQSMQLNYASGTGTGPIVP